MKVRAINALLSSTFIFSTLLFSSSLHAASASSAAASKSCCPAGGSTGSTGDGGGNHPVPPTPITPSFYASWTFYAMFTTLSKGDPIPTYNSDGGEVSLGSAISRVDETTLMLEPGYYEVLLVVQESQESQSANIQLEVNGTLRGPEPEFVTGGPSTDNGGCIPLLTIIRVNSPSTLRLICTDVSGNLGMSLNEDTPTMITVKLLATI